MIQCILNNETIQTELPPGGTVLDFVRYHRRLCGTKIGCREGDCGACTVLVGERQGGTIRYRSMTSCLTPLANIQGKHVVTIEGINHPERQVLTPVQEALVEEHGTQCGFCTPGFVLSLTGFCLQSSGTAPANAIAAIDGNICRCTGYKSIERASHQISEMLQGRKQLPALAFAVQQGIVPPYFTGIAARLEALTSPASETSGAPASKPVGGGTDLYVQHPEEMPKETARHLFDDSRLRGIRELGEDIEIGAACTVTDLLESPLLQAIFPKLSEHLKLVSSTPIRNMATLAGNLVNASPIGDLSIWLLALDARVVLRNGSSRTLPLREFFLGYKQLAKTADELVESIVFQKPPGHFLFNFEKVCKRTHLDIASVNSAIGLQTLDGNITAAHLSVGGVSAVPLYLSKTAACLLGKNWPLSAADQTAAEYLLQTEICPISDVRGSAAYKRLLARQLFRAHLQRLSA
ncbi:MAG: FAD binding domain-containing protein [Saprospiraceae bacterium]|nr:FAD binding domain-containing protein [Saprospiraceae bacterium]